LVNGYWKLRRERVRKERIPLEGEERRNAAKTVTSRPCGLPFFGSELYKEITFSDTLWPKLVPSEEAIDMALCKCSECVSRVNSSDCERERETTLSIYFSKVAP